MKELSIEEKAKRYDEALEEAKKFYALCKKCGAIDTINFLENTFPELKESKDERIRRIIRGWIYTQPASFFDNGISKEEILSWLEKQSEKQNWKPSKEQINALEHFVRSIGESGYASPYNSNTQLLYSLLNDLCKLEKQGGQKLTNKVESKFHEGEYIVDNCGYVWKIEGILNQFYILEGVEGGESRPTIEWVDKTFHLWTIKDAKDGDVLVSRSPFIHNKQRPYGGLNWYNNKFIKASNFIFADDPVHPATKEQRNLLLQKMKEAGYEWDAKNKKLKNIEI